MRRRGSHKAVGLYAHVTWHTLWRQQSIREVDVSTIAQSIMAAAARTGVRVPAQAVLSDHVHVVVSYSSDARISDFIREAKSESARRVNDQCGSLALHWCRGFYANSLSRSHVRAARSYVARQRAHHPDRLPIPVC